MSAVSFIEFTLVCAEFTAAWACDTAAWKVTWSSTKSVWPFLHILPLVTHHAGDKTAHERTHIHVDLPLDSGGIGIGEIGSAALQREHGKLGSLILHGGHLRGLVILA